MNLSKIVRKNRYAPAVPEERRSRPVSKWTGLKPVAVSIHKFRNAPSPALPNRHERRMFAKLGTPIAKPDRGKLMALAERLNADTREPRQQGALKQTGIAVFRALLFRRWNHYTGQCNPSYVTIANDAGVSVRSVARAVARLRQAGLLHWLASFAAGKRSSNRYRIGSGCQNGAESTGQDSLVDGLNGSTLRALVHEVAKAIGLPEMLLATYGIAHRLAP